MTHWRDYAACQYAEVEVFFPGPGQGGEDAKRICAVCPVINECFEFAMTNAEGFGVFGGCTAPERYRLAQELGYPLPVTRSFHAEEVLAAELGEVVAE